MAEMRYLIIHVHTVSVSLLTPEYVLSDWVLKVDGSEQWNKGTSYRFRYR
jgi:hypothetical protein